MSKEKKPSFFQEYMDAGTLGIQLVLSVALAAGIGYWLDRRYKTFPWITIVGFILGLAAGLRSAYKVIVKEVGSDKDETKKGEQD